MTLYVILLIGGLYLLIKGSDIFVDSSVHVAKTFGISEVLLGMTLVCFGTSLPELFVSVNGSIKGTADLVIGNMVGTNLFNICVILGAVSIIHPVKFLKDTVRKDMYMSLVTAVVFFLVIFDIPGTFLTQNVISRTDGAILLVLFVLFMYYNLYHFDSITIRTRKRKLQRESGTYVKHKKEGMSVKQKNELIKNILLCILGAALVYVGSECVLNGAVGAATELGVSETFIAVLVIAVGTSLPEIATSISAIKKKRINVAVGNLIGSNMYNMLFITGLSAVINPLTVSSSAIWTDAIIFIFITLILIVFTKIRFVRKGSYELSRIEGIILLIIYIAYASYVIIRG